MTLQYSVTLRDNQLNQVESTVGSSGSLEIRSGSPPADCAAADSGTLLATITLPSNWMADAASGSVSLAGSWTVPAATATGTAGHWRIKAGSTCHVQGTCGLPASGADMILDNTSIATGQSVTVTSFSISAGNA